MDRAWIGQTDPVPRRAPRIEGRALLIVMSGHATRLRWPYPWPEPSSRPARTVGTLTNLPGKIRRSRWRPPLEGCVRECWGTLCAHYQAQTATDVRAVWRDIGGDETEHAQLSCWRAY
jgi:hypothetical protein